MRRAVLSLVIVIELAGSAHAETWVLWEHHTGERPAAIETYDDKSTCVKASDVAAQKYLEESQRTAARYAPNSRETYDVATISGGYIVTFGREKSMMVPVMEYRCWPVGVNPQ
jgi:hypothetical protein